MGFLACVEQGGVIKLTKGTKGISREFTAETDGCAPVRKIRLYDIRRNWKSASTGS